MLDICADVWGEARKLTELTAGTADGSANAQPPSSPAAAAVSANVHPLSSVVVAASVNVYPLSLMNVVFAANAYPLSTMDMVVSGVMVKPTVPFVNSNPPDAMLLEALISLVSANDAELAWRAF